MAWVEEGNTHCQKFALLKLGSSEIRATIFIVAGIQGRSMLKETSLTTALPTPVYFPLINGASWGWKVLVPEEPLAGEAELFKWRGRMQCVLIHSLLESRQEGENSVVVFLTGFPPCQIDLVKHHYLQQSQKDYRPYHLTYFVSPTFLFDMKEVCKVTLILQLRQWTFWNLFSLQN